MTTLSEIEKFLESRKFAIAGVSRSEKKFGGAIFKELKAKGFDLYPINPNAENIQGIKCYKSVVDLPSEVSHLLIVTPKAETAAVAQEAVEKGVEMVWIQQKSDTPEAVEIIENAGISLICKKCIMMFASPVKGVHGFHRAIVKLFGAYPKIAAPLVN